MTSLKAFLDKPRSGKKRVCLVTSIFHGFGKIGGFGAMAKSLAIVLVENDYEVIVVAPRRKGQEPITQVRGFTVLGLTMKELVNPSLYARIGADIYHSQSPNLMSAAAKLGRGKAKHDRQRRERRDRGEARPRSPASRAGAERATQQYLMQAGSLFSGGKRGDSEKLILKILTLVKIGKNEDNIRDDVNIRAALLIYGVFDFATMGAVAPGATPDVPEAMAEAGPKLVELMVGSYLGPESERQSKLEDPRVSPIHAADRLPPSHVVCGGADPSRRW